MPYALAVSEAWRSSTLCCPAVCLDRVSEGGRRGSKRDVSYWCVLLLTTYARRLHVALLSRRSRRVAVSTISLHRGSLDSPAIRSPERK